jgi:DivIVA domain-containing protein
MPDQSYAATEHALLEEITRPLERIPEDPIELVQADFPTTMRGYDKAAVDEYVRETSQLVAELQAVRSPESAVRRALVRAGGQISGVLRRAHEIAAEITASSRSEAEDLLERARAEAGEIVDTAERRVRDLDADTDRIWLDRQRIMADVEDLSNQLLELARQAGARFPDDDEHAAYDQEQAEPRASSAHRMEPVVEQPQPPQAAAAHGFDTWTPVESAAREESMARDQRMSETDETPAAPAESTAPETPLPRDDCATREAGGAELTDHDETLSFAAPDSFELAEPPEVEPRSARLWPDRGSEDDRGDGEPGSGRAIPPMSDAGNRPRRS